MKYNTISAGQRVFSPPQLAAKTNRDRTTVWRAIQRGELPAFQIGPHYYVNERDAEAYIERCTKGTRGAE